MIKIIVHAFVETEETVVEMLFTSANEQSVLAKMTDFQKIYPADFLAIYDLPFECGLADLPHHPVCSHQQGRFKVSYLSYFIYLFGGTEVRY
ncbi:hypothetical protein [Streptococcus sobrinus]|uniref:Uncharacterized protein n=2 Tax=Streptococcus sobrinus TaxID=1310 RepID=U2K9A9_9STRE|nr:hypothetical protein [Streptococcus sobrinus]RKV96184.1 MAG: addiction module component [Streptococcus sp.]AWN19589.1 addiction module component [Streptococcus sobrinus]AWN21536.1 addiction module component [Streptococcus sobrinus]AWN62320.1 addiction module component [Streptococcus sobrinus]AWN64194.1 addiction module component [Streptococcus sobrinus]